MNRPMIHLKNCFLFLAKRNYTCIVERLEKAPLAKKGVDVRKIKLTSNHYHYKLVDCLHTKKWGNMNLILTQYVEGVGNKGEFVSVSRHMAHYELLPAQLAVFPTEENIEFYKEDAALLKDKPKVSKYAAYARDHINKMVLEIQMNTSAKWTLNKDHIRIALRNKEIMATNDSIKLPDNFESIKCDSEKWFKDEFVVDIKINEYTDAKLKCKITAIDKNKLWEKFSIFNKKI